MVTKEKAKEYKARYRSNLENRIKEQKYLKEWRSKPETKKHLKEYYSKPEVKKRRNDFYSQEDVKKRKSEYCSRKEVRAKTNLWVKQYRQQPTIRIAHSVSSRLTKLINKDSKATTYLLGYSMQKLRQHIENQFTHEMNWKNYGAVWEIDHKVPVSWCKTKEQVIRAFRLSNLQPVIKNENKKKRNFWVIDKSKEIKQGIIYL